MTAASRRASCPRRCCISAIEPSVQDAAAHELDVEVAHAACARRPASRDEREGLGLDRGERWSRRPRRRRCGPGRRRGGAAKRARSSSSPSAANSSARRLAARATCSRSLSLLPSPKRRTRFSSSAMGQGYHRGRLRCAPRPGTGLCQGSRVPLLSRGWEARGHSMGARWICSGRSSRGQATRLEVARRADLWASTAHLGGGLAGRAAGRPDGAVPLGTVDAPRRPRESGSPSPSRDLDPDQAAVVLGVADAAGAAGGAAGARRARHDARRGAAPRRARAARHRRRPRGPRTRCGGDATPWPAWLDRTVLDPDAFARHHLGRAATRRRTP